MSALRAGLQQKPLVVQRVEPLIDLMMLCSRFGHAVSRVVGRSARSCNQDRCTIRAEVFVLILFGKDRL
jgi:hypothetical protein